MIALKIIILGLAFKQRTSTNLSPALACLAGLIIVKSPDGGQKKARLFLKPFFVCGKLGVSATPRLVAEGEAEASRQRKRRSVDTTLNTKEAVAVDYQECRGFFSSSI